VNVPDERGGYTGFQLFKECRVFIGEDSEWYVEIDAHDKALPLMFEFQSRFFSYHLWNALRLRSSNQLRMYEILKQYEKIGSRVVGVDELKKLLGVDKNEYPRFNDFKIRVLDACQQVLQENTDIKFTYEPYGKKCRGGKIMYLKFRIEKNEGYTDQLTLSMFINENRREIESPAPMRDEKMSFLAEACGNEFTENEITVLFDEMKKCLPFSLIKDDIQCYDYLCDKYHEMLMRDEKNKITHRLAYLRSIIGKDYEP
jgi:plasmid replication initiation protein